MTPNRHPRLDEPPTAILAILDTFRRHPGAVSERAVESLKSFGLLDGSEAGVPSRSRHLR